MLLPASIWMDAAWMVPPPPFQIPFNVAVVLMPWKTTFELPVTKRVVTVTVAPPPTLKVPPADTVKLVTERVLPAPSESEPWLLTVILGKVRVEFGGNTRLSETVRLTFAPRI